MTKFKLFLLLLFSFFSISAQSNTEFDSVSSVKLNNVELVNAITPDKINFIFKEIGKEQPVIFSQCTANYDMEIHYPQKTVKLEFFEEDNSATDLSKVFAKKRLPANYKNKLKAVLWVDWHDMSGFNEELKVGNVTITPALTLEAFKKHFPLSSKQTDNHFKQLDISHSIYHVTFADQKTLELLKQENDQLSPPYDASVQFTFKNGKLHQLAILQGVAC